MKNNINILIASAWLMFTLSSCSNNNIYFDINSQSVKTCNKHEIGTLIISSIESNEFYIFSLSENEGTNNFSLIKIDHNYLLEDRRNNISIDSFRLKPETTYKISNITFGDADHTRILIKTDKEGKVIYSDVTSCN